MRVLALDVGDKRIGVAISDPSQVLARSLKVIQRGSRQEDFAAVARLVEEYEVEKVVVGYPLSLDGKAHAQEDGALCHGFGRISNRADAFVGRAFFHRHRRKADEGSGSERQEGAGES